MLSPSAGVGGTFDGAEQLMQQFSSFGQQQQQQQQSNLNGLSGLSSQFGGNIPTSVVPNQMGNQGGNSIENNTTEDPTEHMVKKYFEKEPFHCSLYRYLFQNSLSVGFSVEFFVN